MRKMWKHLLVGDIVHLSCNEIIPADLLLLRSSDPSESCFVETSNLDGESNLKQRHCIGSLTNKVKKITVFSFLLKILAEDFRVTFILSISRAQLNARCPTIRSTNSAVSCMYCKD